MDEAGLKLADGRVLAVDDKGYLLDSADWERSVAQQMAKNDGIAMGEDHFAVIDIFREYFARYEIEPPMRALVKLVAATLGEDKGNSRFLYQLFPQGPVTQASRYAGLPRPLSCI
jgi:tRNA 2-thiouridine synthesizing protein E